MGRVFTVIFYALWLLIILPLLVLYAVGWLLQYPWLAVKDMLEDFFSFF